MHYFDMLRWILDEQAPSSVCAMGGKFAVKDARGIPDTMEVVFVSPGSANSLLNYPYRPPWKL